MCAWSIAEDRPPLVDGRAEDRLSDRCRENVVEIEVQLRHRADAGAARAVDRDDRLERDLEVVPDPDHPRIDRAGGADSGVEVVADRVWKFHSTIGIR